jgi:hypothetical protein
MLRRRYQVLRLLAVVSILSALAVLDLRAHDAAARSSFRVIASHLDNPRGLAVGSNGALYVAEAGQGGSGRCIPGPEGSGEVCYGATGAVTRIWRGRQARIATGLPSLAGSDGGFAVGPHDVSLWGSSVYTIVGLAANPARRSALGPAGADFGQLVTLAARGRWRTIADVAAYETAANPDRGALDSNPYAVLALPNKWIVVDAGANALLQVAPNGSIKTLAVFPTRMVPAPPMPGRPDAAQAIPMQSVPNSVVRGPDGAYYVGELTGFPFPVGGARVYRVVPGKAPKIYATGFTNIIDLAFACDGSLYVLEITAKGLLQAGGPGGDPTGALIRVARNGTQTTVVSQGLVMPTSVAIGPDGGIYVSNFGVFAEKGQVVRVGHVPAPHHAEHECD